MATRYTASQASLVNPGTFDERSGTLLSFNLNFWSRLMAGYLQAKCYSIDCVWDHFEHPSNCYLLREPQISI